MVVNVVKTRYCLHASIHFYISSAIFPSVSWFQLWGLSILLIWVPASLILWPLSLIKGDMYKHRKDWHPVRWGKSAGKFWIFFEVWNKNKYLLWLEPSSILLIVPCNRLLLSPTHYESTFLNLSQDGCTPSNILLDLVGILRELKLRCCEKLFNRWQVVLSFYGSGSVGNKPFWQRIARNFSRKM